MAEGAESNKKMTMTKCKRGVNFSNAGRENAVNKR